MKGIHLAALSALCLVLVSGAEGAPAVRGAAIPPARQRIERAVNQLLRQSDVFFHAGDYESTRACYAIITDLDPTFIEGWQDYGWLLWSGLGRDDAAMRVFQRGLRYHPERYELYFEIGELEYHRRHFLSAAQWLAKATSHQAPSMVWHMRAHCLEYAGEIEKAKGMWRTIIRKFPKDAPAPINLKRLEEGRIRLNPVIGVEQPRSAAPSAPAEPPAPPAPWDPNSI